MNAQTEFLEHIKGKPKVLCAQFRFGDIDADEWTDVPSEELILVMGWKIEDWNKFLMSIDKEYDSGYGSQHLFGFIWYEGMTWSTRGEYDGAEWWEYHHVPEIPFKLFRKIE